MLLSMKTMSQHREPITWPWIWVLFLELNSANCPTTTLQSYQEWGLTHALMMPHASAGLWMEAWNCLPLNCEI